MSDETDKSKEKHITKIVSGEARIGSEKDETIGSKMKRAFLPSDMKTFGDYVMANIIIPEMKDVIHSILSSSVDAMFGETKRTSGSRIPGASYSYLSDYRTVNRTNYSKISSAAPKRIETRSIGEGGSEEQVRRFTFENKADAESVLELAEDIIDTYGVVSVSDIYEMAGLGECPYTLNRYGWTNVSMNSSITRIASGDYMLTLPKPRVITQ